MHFDPLCGKPRSRRDEIFANTMNAKTPRNNLVWHGATVTPELQEWAFAYTFHGLMTLTLAAS